MRKLTIMEHISLDGVIQSSGEDNFPYSNWTSPYRTRWPRRTPRRAWRELRSGAWAPHLRSLVGLLAEGAEQPHGGPPECGDKIYCYPSS